MEVMLQWADDLDDLLAAGLQLVEAYGYRLLGLAGVAAAGISGIAIGIGVGVLWG
ncbi:MAG TPA: hypothetical protein PLS34_08545 [Gammaproteobacteria bacterium]|nr:hypothetical protein [Gammaproteobacteria bacterium]